MMFLKMKDSLFFYSGGDIKSIQDQRGQKTFKKIFFPAAKTADKREPAAAMWHDMSQRLRGELQMQLENQ